MKASALIKLAIVAVVVGLFVWLGTQSTRTWAVVSQDVERQTVPTRTYTPGPTTPTPIATDTPVPVATTAAPGSPTPSATPVLTPTLPGGSGSAPAALPTAGGGPLLLLGGAFLLVNGALLLLAGLQMNRGER
jgi:hypothetical protein